jgi:short-subunit dehydrogenase
MGKVEGKAVITGATGGIGFTVKKRLGVKMIYCDFERYRR